MSEVDWQVAGSLNRLLTQLNDLAPRRSHDSDGSIGDAAHAGRGRASDHNPWMVLHGQAYVTARDFTHDPRGGLDCRRLAEALQHGRDPRLKYVIWDGHIMAGHAGPRPWVWRPYGGPNPHERHLHLSVVPDARSLSRDPWQLPGLEDTPMSAETERLIREVHTALHVRLPNRRGPGGDEIVGGGADTPLSYAVNADGMGFRIEALLRDMRQVLDDLARRLED